MDCKETQRPSRYSFSRPRSRYGCGPCKKLRRKCSEERPSCARCLELSLHCQYTVKLSWGGRNFRKSRFGQCLDISMTRTTTPNTGFIYGVDGVNSLVIASAGPDASEDSSAESDQAQSPKVYLANRHIKPDPPGIPLRRYQELLTLDMNPSDRFLLDHFVKLSSVFLSSHDSICRRVLTELVPMSLQTPHLMWSILALACRSCLSSGLSSIMGADTETMMLQFSSSSFRSLQQAISTSPENDSLVPTTLLLCLGEIYGGRTQSKSWIVHLKGARALMAVRDWSISEVANDQRESSLLWGNLFLSITIQASLCSNLWGHDWLRTEMLTTSGEHFVDELLAFSTELIPILLSIGQLEQQPRQSRVPHGEDLLRKLNAMIERHERDPPPLRRALHASTPEVEAHQFALSSAAYHYATQIHIYRRLLDRPSESSGQRSQYPSLRGADGQRRRRSSVDHYGDAVIYGRVRGP
ncbi:hypothetical protein ABEF92_007495 [Exophiala dermatitidis]|uniref:Zn(2)-C6 fungal-type domain-containing protein n=1 Tax=Exophiala dermatitidis (strain ATCC 34100 / CBS 525.76 / NIH/UT8656) TaxID=858893 RepID=H6BZM1_EXODN|nr:uncharacterized protein HMPREF1120_04347 [Exophiala dermatitidis NIH/UT8656]EHY56260.1 hypothetical protein HMPREF1120_04347 [Exophiala dermatitidis NIH/UT8656]